jgi:hypothetical protein
MSCCDPHPFTLSQQGRLVYPGSETTRMGPERPQRITRINRTGRRMLFGVAVTDAAEDDGCRPPETEWDRIIGFTLQVTEEDILVGRNWVPQPFPFYRPNDAVCISLNDRIWAIAPSDVFVADRVFVEPGTGLPAEFGLLAKGCTWESVAMKGSLAVIQLATRSIYR